MIMLEINIQDVYNILNTCKTYLIVLGIVLLSGIILVLAVRKVEPAKRKMIRSQTGIAVLLVIIIIANLVVTGPMSTIISLAMGSGTVSEDALKKAEEVSREVAEEGFVLLKNEDNVLPLSGQNKLNVFGWSSTNPCYGGTGSGGLSDNYEEVTLLQGLENAGFETNKELSDFYVDYRADRPILDMYGEDGNGLNAEMNWSIPEPPVDSYSDTLLQNAKDFSDVALVVFSRTGGEGFDLPTDMNTVDYEPNSSDYDDFPEGSHYLELCQSELKMLEMVCSNFEKIIVAYNGVNSLEMGFLNEYEQIKGAILCPGPGQNGFNALGTILSGETNPSGKTVDTLVKDFTKAPTWNNFGDFTYENMDEFAVDGQAPTFINYSEGIYVGYRFYETAAVEGLLDYDDEVVYPFGYGLSYTEFTQEMSELNIEDGQISFDVEVTNVGNTAGKEVVEVYYNPPYSDGGIEKSAVNLLQFEKTKMLEPGESETVKITFNEEDMASYDSKDEKAYVLEEGDYIISINSDAHNIIQTQTYTVKDTIIYNAENKRSTDNSVATNVFDDAKGDVTYLSRKGHFENYQEAVSAPETLSMPEEDKNKFINNANYNPEDYNNDNDTMPVTGTDKGVSLEELRGLPYDDAKWEDLLDQLTVEEMREMIAIAGFQTAEVESVGKAGTVDCDGTMAVYNNFTGVGTIAFPAPVVLASTWNKELAKKSGESIGSMADEMEVSGWYAPAMNTHRTPFGGRNFEYYSEDGVLAGYIAESVVRGANEYGVYAYIKHFALNEQETNRLAMLCTWIDEQAVREIYLKPFELSVKEGNATAVMSAFNYIGTIYAGAHNGLLQTILRDEWGFNGIVLTDWFGGYGFQDADQIIRNGGDACLVNYDVQTNYLDDTDSATAVCAMRKAAKNIMYTVVNSRSYQGENVQAGMKSWQIALVVIDVILAMGLVVLEIIAWKKYKRRNNANKIIIESVAKE